MNFFTAAVLRREKWRTAKKALLIMKLTMLLTMALIFEAAASVSGQSINFSAKRMPLKAVFQEIQKQSGYIVFYKTSILQKSSPVSVDLKNATIEQAMESAIGDQPFSFEVIEKTVLVREKSRSLFDRVSDFFRQIDITGKVIDENGGPLPGASVRTDGKATVTNSAGEFSLKGITEGANIEISYVGYKTQNIKAEKTAIRITMERSAGELDEVVTKGYYTTSRKLNTGNVGTVRSDEIEKQPVTDPVSALMGRVAGVYIRPSSGVTGRDNVIRVRGINSLNASVGSVPLYVIDGVPFNSSPLSTNSFNAGQGNPSPLNDLDINSIEKIEVLKDADATAIYGSRGTNGVILITTKKGKPGKAELNIRAYTGINNASRMRKLLNTEEYLAMRRQAFAADGTTPSATDYDLNGTWDQSRYTDWQDLILGNTGHTNDLQASVSGGTSFTQFRLSGGYHHETNILPGDQAARKINSQVSLTHRSENGKFNLNFSASYVNNFTNLPAEDLVSFTLLAPNAPAIYNAAGGLNWEPLSSGTATWANPFVGLVKQYTESSNNLLSNLTLSYELSDGLTLKSSFGYNREELEQMRKSPYTAFNPATTTDPTTVRRFDLANRNIRNWIIEPQLSYNRLIWKGKLDALVGVTFQDNSASEISQFASGYSSDALLGDLSAGATKGVNSNNQTQYRYNAIYGRIGYNVMEKYLLNLTARRDGSSRFGSLHRFGNFGAVGAAWIFGSEDFFKNSLPWFSFGKLRGSIGTTGNDSLGEYGYLDTYGAYTTSYQGLKGLNPLRLANDDYSWEKVTKMELALETGFFNDRILFNASIYRNRTDNQLVGYSLPSFVGFTSVSGNLPAIIQNQGLELELSTKNIQGRDFRWDTSLNFTIARNKLIDFPNIAATSYSNTYFIGMNLSARPYYHYTGLDPNTGTYTFQDMNGDGLITTAFDRTPIFIGQKFFGGMNNTFRYKNWQLDVFTTFAKQEANNFLTFSLPGFFNSGKNNLFKDYLDNQQDYQRPSTLTTGAIWNQFLLFNSSDATISDASYIRLKNVALTYNFPSNFLRTNFIKGGRIFIQAQNLITITGYKGSDPELANAASSAFITPTMRTVTAGLSINL